MTDKSTHACFTDILEILRYICGSMHTALHIFDKDRVPSNYIMPLGKLSCNNQV